MNLLFSFMITGLLTFLGFAVALMLLPLSGWLSLLCLGTTLWTVHARASASD